MGAKQFPCLAHDLAIPMGGDEETQILPSISPVHHEKPCVPESHDKWNSSFPQRSWDFWRDHFKTHGSSQDPDCPIGEPGSQPSHHLLFQRFKERHLNVRFQISDFKLKQVIKQKL